ncbi:hypothetical protein [Sphingomonas desiccabilis]|uniref:Uncharacterized protein n=1 Tax=Sphingomonas desiccabilis TaxID=429134 RepID=A0A4Q2IUA0_9SPHN|nr:hypothetical protein [Sphingomonas desiccabilis]MBB3911449.1 hypothetical protein [Sphingomonas desiccabilis]RXZ31779.1 hypothetical protein EO081_11290 [Sphingomonas desiccabilis]
MTPFTEAELLADSAEYLAQLEASGRLGAAEPRVCHHFFPLDGASEDAYLPALPSALAELDPDALIAVIGDPVGVELWQLVEPDRNWLTGQIRAFHLAAVSCSAVYAGWSYEPERERTNGS